MRVARLFLAILMLALALGASALPATAQGVGFEDMTGLQEAVTRTFSGETGFDSGAETGLRDAGKPNISLLLTAVYTFDTEANAAASYELLQTDMNATGVSGQPLELTPITLPLGLEHTAASAVDTTSGTTIDFRLVMALDGTLVYTVIAITSGAPPDGDVAALVRSMAAAEIRAEPVAFDASGGSTGGVWTKVPTRAAVERDFRGITSVEDAAPFPA
jgi:hypothetical protein